MTCALFAYHGFVESIGRFVKYTMGRRGGGVIDVGEGVEVVVVDVGMSSVMTFASTIAASLGVPPSGRLLNQYCWICRDTAICQTRRQRRVILLNKVNTKLVDAMERYPTNETTKMVLWQRNSFRLPTRAMFLVDGREHKKFALPLGEYSIAKQK